MNVKKTNLIRFDNILIVIAAIVGFCALIGLGLLLRTHFIANDLLLLTSRDDVNDIIRKFGKAEEVFTEGQLINGRGWPIPKRPIENKHVVMVFVRSLNIKYYVYVNDKQQITYVFSAGS